MLFNALFDQSTFFGWVGTGHRWLLIQFCLILRSTHIEHIVLNFSIPVKLTSHLPGDLLSGLTHCAVAFSLFFGVPQFRAFLGLPFTTVYLDAFALLFEWILHHP
jgi:hypothetical protein